MKILSVKLKIFTSKIYLSKFHENSILLRGVDSIFNFAYHLPLKLSHSLPQQFHIFMKVWKDGLLMNIFNSVEGTFDIYCQNKDIIDFYNLQGKLEHIPLTV